MNSNVSLSAAQKLALVSASRHNYYAIIFSFLLIIINHYLLLVFDLLIYFLSLKIPLIKSWLNLFINVQSLHVPHDTDNMKQYISGVDMYKVMTM